MTVKWAAFAGLLLIQAGSAAEPGLARPDLDPANEKAQLLRAQANYAIWLISDLHPETAQHRAPTFTHRFYRQPMGEQDRKASLIYELQDTSVQFAIAVRKDGSILLETRRRVHFVPASGPAVTQDLRWLDRLAVYPDGLLVQDWSDRHPKQFQPVWFVPFDGERLRIDDRVQVADAGIKPFAREEGLGYPGEPYRFGNLLAWVADSTLHTFDLTSGERKRVKLRIKLHPSDRVTAFDGATLVCGRFAFDATSGELLGEPEYSKRPGNVASVFAVRNRIGYYYESGRLRATGLASKDGASNALCHAEPIVPLQGDEGLTVWDGKRWLLVRWLTDLRRQDQAVPPTK